MSSRAYFELYYHITWHTKDSLQMITPEIEHHLYKYIRAKILETPGAAVHALGGVTEHLHIACSLPPVVQLGEWIGRLKGSSAHYINHNVRPKSLQWQSGYGVVTFGKKDLAWVIDYVEKQKEHHRLRNTYPRLESISFDGQSRVIGKPAKAG